MRSGVICVAVAAGLASSCFAGPDPTVVGGRPAAHRPSGNHGGLDAFPFSDNFDGHPTGPNFPCTGAACSGPNGWSIWYAGGVGGNIVAGGAHSGANSFELVPGTDVVQTGLLTSGTHEIKAQTFIPSSQTGLGYFIVMHSYNGVPGADDWAIEIQFNGQSGQVIDDISGVEPPVQTPIGTIVRDQWVEVKAVVNLDTNTYNFFYNGAQLITNGVYAPTGTPAIACLDLYSATMTFRYDTVSVAAAGGGCYANCDGSTTAPVLNVADFTCFLQQFSAGNSYANCDGSTQAPVLNVADFTCFLQRFAAGCQ